MQKKELLFKLSKKDFIQQYYKGSGAGGQNRNKRETGVRIVHPDSGARAECCEQRHREQNKKIAFQRLVKTSEFQKWHKRKCAEILNNKIDIEKQVEEWMNEENLKIECCLDGKWISIK